MFCKTVQEAERILTILNNTCKRFGVTITFSKTKTQIFNDHVLAEKPTLFNVDGNVVQNVTEFTYLGQLITTGKKSLLH